jgi:hypothetical protein
MSAVREAAQPSAPLASPPTRDDFLRVMVQALGPQEIQEVSEMTRKIVESEMAASLASPRE